VPDLGLGPCKSGNFGGPDFFTEALDAFESAGRPPAKAHCMNLISIFILTALIFEFVLHRLSEALNLRSASSKVPDAFKDLYDSQRYARAQDYLRTRTRFVWISSGVFLAATLAFWLGGGFGFLDDRVRSLDHGPILSGLIYVGALWIGRSILAVPFMVKKSHRM
jgi:STE24 endopeptidase